MAIFICTMSVKSPSGTSNEVPVEVHKVLGEKSHKHPKRSTDKDRREVIIHFRYNDMANAQLSALQKNMEKGFSQMTVFGEYFISNT